MSTINMYYSKHRFIPKSNYYVTIAINGINFTAFESMHPEIVAFVIQEIKSHSSKPVNDSYRFLMMPTKEFVTDLLSSNKLDLFKTTNLYSSFLECVDDIHLSALKSLKNKKTFKAL